jgi:hypothetical protein
MPFSFYRGPSLERRNIMRFSSWLAKRQRSASSALIHKPTRKRSTFRPRLEALEGRWLPSQIGLTVTSLADSGPGTLRAAILTADAGSHSDQFTIGFAVTGTIDLQSPLPDLNNSITIQGPGASRLTVERAAGISFPSAIVTMDAGQSATLSGVTIANGNEGGITNEGTLTVANCKVMNNTGSPHGPSIVSLGGGIYNDGTLTVDDSIVSGNAAAFGGGIYSDGALTVSASIVSANSAVGYFDTQFGMHRPGDGGGIFSSGILSSGIFGTGTLTVSGSSFSGNSAPSGHGGGIVNAFGALTVSSSTISNNSAAFGGGIYNTGNQIFSNGTATIGDCTISCNSAQVSGGGVLNSSFMTVKGCDVFHNDSSQGFGGGIYNGGWMSIQTSGFTGNSGVVGGALFNLNTVTLSGCAFTGNTATGSALVFGFGDVSGGGAIVNLQSMAIRDCMFTGNSAGQGGAIFNDAPKELPLTISGSTFTANTASDTGGALYNDSTATLQQCTLSGNTAANNGGGIFNAASGTVAVKDTTVLHNVALLGADLFNDHGNVTVNDSIIGDWFNA